MSLDFGKFRQFVKKSISLPFSFFLHFPIWLSCLVWRGGPGALLMEIQDGLLRYSRGNLWFVPLTLSLSLSLGGLSLDSRRLTEGRRHKWCYHIRRQSAFFGLWFLSGDIRKHLSFANKWCSLLKASVSPFCFHFTLVLLMYINIWNKCSEE